MNYKDLRNRTIFDFTDNDEIIKKIIGETPKDFYIKNSHPLSKLADIQDFAFLTDNKDLYKVVADERKKAESEWEQMRSDAQDEGLLID